jgi:hypothetical protein
VQACSSNDELGDRERAIIFVSIIVSIGVLTSARGKRGRPGEYSIGKSEQ